MAMRNAQTFPFWARADLRATRPAAAWRRLGLLFRTMRTRRQLARLDERALKDIGLNRAQALEEASRMPWDIGPRC